MNRTLAAYLIMLLILTLLPVSTGCKNEDSDCPECEGDDDTIDDDDDDTVDDDDDDTIDDDDDDDDDIYDAWTDPDTGLMWQNPPPDGWFNWQHALDYCENLELKGYTDWRVPTLNELRSLVSGCPDTETGGDCTATDDCLGWECWNRPCDGCAYRLGPGIEGCYWNPDLSNDCGAYWSSSTRTDNTRCAWFVGYVDAMVAYYYKEYMAIRVRCVR